MTNKEHKPLFRSPFFLITYGILLYMGLQNFSSIQNIFVWLFSILRPVAYGISIAFIINLFLTFFQEKVFRQMSRSSRKIEQKLCPVLCAVCTALVAAILVCMIVFLIIPQVRTAIYAMAEKMPSSQEQIYAIVTEKLKAWNAPPIIMEKLDQFNVDWDTAFDWISDFMDGKVETVLGKAFSATSSVLSAATNLLLGTIIAVYLLAQKKRVLFVTHKFVQLITPERYHLRVARILHLANKSFANFLTGQFIEAIIIGTLCTIGLTIFQFPYAATIGMLTGLTALLPIIGAWIGGGIGALLIFVEAPERVIWFLVFIFALQQLEGQFIYPKVVGNSIGLPGVLVLIAVILGGGLGGIFGIIFTVPVFAILYQLLKEAIDSMPEDDAAESETADSAAETEPAVPEPEQPEIAAEPVPAIPAPVPAKINAPRKKRRRKH
ncbi:MAG: AI-2E family transporter [Oscillospiraceae bacterium]|nr:AI-2E family transporter [Oscillospiraceae bacterium]